jgi:hypothetical protein
MLSTPVMLSTPGCRLSQARFLLNSMQPMAQNCTLCLV